MEKNIEKLMGQVLILEQKIVENDVTLSDTYQRVNYLEDAIKILNTKIDMYDMIFKSLTEQMDELGNKKRNKK